MAHPAANLFLDRLSELPHFENIQEVQSLVDQYGVSVALVQAIADRKLVSKETVCRLWADSLERAYVDPFASVITDEAIARFPIEIAKRANAIGLYVIDGVLTTAMSTPEDADLIARLGEIARMPISPVFALPRDIEDAIIIQYASDHRLERSLRDLEKSSLFADPQLAHEKIAQLAASEEVASVVDEILQYALRERATDVHIEPQETLSRVRFRVDGKLREVLTYSRSLHKTIASRLKILANLNAAEPRFPQEGPFSIGVGNAAAYFTLSTVPSSHGEKLVASVIAGGQHRTMLTLDKMGISQTTIGSLKVLLQAPTGFFCFTGPSGSGKSTTWYATLHELNKADLSIITIEEPIELPMEGVTQLEVNRSIDLKPAGLLRSALRQDPDVIAVSEVRDSESVRVSVDAATTGHRVLTTLPANNALQALQRLQAFNGDSATLAAALTGIFAQRLVAKICDHCKEPYTPTAQVLGRHFQDYELAAPQFFRGLGCPDCRGTGYRGQIALHELLPVTDEVRTMVCEQRSSAEIARAAGKAGYRPMRHDGLKKVLLGLTTIEEIEKNTSFEWDV
ncbi:MAG TPA: GspE/PulE family protein [Opitutaceae bacterium]